MANSPEVTVLMSVYNGMPYLAEAIESILSQSLKDFEFLIIDDCSEDETWEVLKEYASADDRIKLVRNEQNLGLTKSLNKGLRLARGKYIARHDSDDVAAPSRLREQADTLNKQSDTVLVASHMEMIDADGQSFGKFAREYDSDLIGWFLLFYNHIAGHSQVMFRLNSVIDVGGYSEARRYSQDYGLWSNLFRVGKIVILPKFLQKQRFHESSVSAQKRSEQESLSLNQSRDNIKQVCSLELTLEEVKILRQFWRGHLRWSHFPKTDEVEKINSSIKLIYLNYIKEQAKSCSLSGNILKKISLRIGQQYIYWISSLNILKSLPLILKLSYYAMYWHPLGLAAFWLSEPTKIPMRFISLINPKCKETKFSSN